MKTKIDFTKNPYRGALAKVAKDVNETRQSITQKYASGNSDIVDKVNKEIWRRYKIHQENVRLNDVISA